MGKLTAKQIENLTTPGTQPNLYLVFRRKSPTPVEQNMSCQIVEGMEIDRRQRENWNALLTRG
ncbi:hypothetical protein [Pseudomonas orientalis]|uniref:hypothetical protein n=1 Tax=Pseudomonas orientalis TaxID=76758 RepID=UPI0030D8861B